MGRLVRGVTDLGTTNPELAGQWHPTKNGDLTPRDVTAGSAKKVWWLCEYGHDWEAAVGNRNSGRGCPVCAGRQVLLGFNDLGSTNPELAGQWHPTKNGDLTPGDVMAGSRTKVWWLCKQGHEWEAALVDRNAGDGCAVCTGRQVLLGFNDLGSTNPELAGQWHPMKNGDLTPRDVTAGSAKKVWWLCEYGHEWEALIGNRNRGTGCPVCAGQNIELGFNDLGTTNPELAGQWHPTKNGDLTPGDVMASTNKRVWWLCGYGHEWEAKIANRSRGTGCPYCSGRSAIRGESDLGTTNPELAGQWHPTKNGDLTPRDVKAGTNKKVWWVCGFGHEWEADINSRNGGTGCPYCSGRSAIRGETDLGTTNPELAGQWHPMKNGDLTSRDVTTGSDKRAWWVCQFGHEWEALIGNRNRGTGCPVCAGQNIELGFNDLGTTNPELAGQWHPTKNGGLTPRDVTTGSGKRVWWLCEYGHDWEAGISSRNGGKGCPYCSGRSAIRGETDLGTTNPELAGQWHPMKNGDLTARDVTTGSAKKVWWLCEYGHEWEALIANRNKGVGCPGCAEYGFDATSPAYLYLMRKEHLGLQQFGISNHPESRLTKHQRNGWELLSIVGPADGYWIREMETALKNFFRDKGLLLLRHYPDKFDGYSESWQSVDLSFSTCAEMLEALRNWEA